MAVVVPRVTSHRSGGVWVSVLPVRAAAVSASVVVWVVWAARACRMARSRVAGAACRAGAEAHDGEVAAGDGLGDGVEELEAGAQGVAGLAGGPGGPLVRAEGGDAGEAGGVAVQPPAQVLAGGAGRLPHPCRGGRVDDRAQVGGQEGPVHLLRVVVPVPGRECHGLVSLSAGRKGGPGSGGLSWGPGRVVVVMVAARTARSSSTSGVMAA
jgi:hypothetical protein